MGWNNKHILWSNDWLQRRKSVADDLAAKGAVHHILPDSGVLHEVDLILTEQPIKENKPDSLGSTPVLRPKETDPDLCCDVLENDLSSIHFLKMLESWRDVAELVRHLGINKVPVINKTTTSSLERLAGIEVLQVGRGKFLNSAGRYIGGLESNKNTPDWEEVTKLLHTLKGSSGTIGADRVSLACKLWEEQIEQGNGATDYSNRLYLLKMLVEYFRFRTLEWGKTSIYGKTNFNG